MPSVYLLCWCLPQKCAGQAVLPRQSGYQEAGEAWTHPIIVHGPHLLPSLLILFRWFNSAVCFHLAPTPRQYPQSLLDPLHLRKKKLFLRPKLCVIQIFFLSISISSNHNRASGFGPPTPPPARARAAFGDFISVLAHVKENRCGSLARSSVLAHHPPGGGLLLIPNSTSLFAPLPLPAVDTRLLHCSHGPAGLRLF